ncbi:hypothetical protein [Pontibacter korlensis]|uniref:hypothetical protein n=1 Tax=Pontibacter korlensis TaxID=400092 RepID=UPI000696C8BD|nr:hypothetical protein [Pontibacter korlensis]
MFGLKEGAIVSIPSGVLQVIVLLKLSFFFMFFFQLPYRQKLGADFSRDTFNSVTATEDNFAQAIALAFFGINSGQA